MANGNFVNATFTMLYKNKFVLVHCTSNITMNVTFNEDTDIKTVKISFDWRACSFEQIGEYAIQILAAYLPD